MKNVTLIKQHLNIQLAHLYEHLFMRQVNQLFYENQLYKNLDYNAHGTVFHQNGIIMVEIDLHTNLALEIENEISNLHIDLGNNNQNISLECARIAAEQPEKLYISDKSAVVSQLHSLDTTPWQHIDDASQINTRDFRQQTFPIYLTDQPAQKPAQMSLTYSLDKKFVQANPELIPLFNVISRVIALTLGHQASAMYGFYENSLNGTAKPPTIKHLFVIDQKIRQDASLEKLETLYENTIPYIFTPKTIKRIVQVLQNTNYRDEIMSSQNIYRVIDETGVITGSVGWKSIATDDAIHSILAHTTAIIRLGRQSVELKNNF